MVDNMPIKTAKSTFMDEALQEARNAAVRGEVPIGAVIVDGKGNILARAGNRTEELSSWTSSNTWVDKCFVWGANEGSKN